MCWWYQIECHVLRFLPYVLECRLALWAFVSGPRFANQIRSTFRVKKHNVVDKRSESIAKINENVGRGNVRDGMGATHLNTYRRGFENIVKFDVLFVTTAWSKSCLAMIKALKKSQFSVKLHTSWGDVDISNVGKFVSPILKRKQWKLFTNNFSLGFLKRINSDSLYTAHRRAEALCSPKHYSCLTWQQIRKPRSTRRWKYISAEI
jgi:hypothetical protein